MQPRPGRENYALVLWLETPRSADVVLKTCVLPDPAFPILLPGQTRRVMWGDIAYPALIVQTGTSCVAEFSTLVKLCLGGGGAHRYSVGHDASKPKQTSRFGGSFTPFS